MSVSDAIVVLDQISDYFEKRKFKKKRIRIVLGSSIIHVDTSVSTPVSWNEILEGTVEAITKNPPGIFLQNAKQYYRRLELRRKKALIKADQWESEGIRDNIYGSHKKGRILVTLSDIRRIEFSNTE